ncbi:MAG: YbjQ family protein [Firmicutes bacterium]|nr:YbjQ family protein [Bacillota bacterium]
MILTTTEHIDGKEYEILGIAKGSTVQTTHMVNDVLQSFKNLVGGELTSYNDMMNEARAMATMRMKNDAERMGADAIVCIRYASSAIMAGAAEVIAYGTAVRFKNQ